MSNKILTCIVNHNVNSNAIILKTMFSNFLETIIIDSKSDSTEEEFDIKLENVGYSGLFNKAYEIALEKKMDGILFICSDVVVKKFQSKQIYEKIININPNEIGVYSPSSKGQSHAHCKKRENGLRDVVFVEGFMFFAFMDILKEIYPVNLKTNFWGYGIDAHKGLICIEKKKRCVIDDDIEVYHKEGTGYDKNMASIQFIKYMEENKNLQNFWIEYQKTNYNSDLTLKKLLKQ